jgi:hypothetical protein
MILEDLVKYLRLDILDDFVSGWDSMVEGSNNSELLWSNESLARYINEAQKQAVRRSLLIKDFTTYTITTVANTSTYTLDSKIIRVKDIDNDTDGLPLTELQYEDVRGVQNWKTAAGTPDYYIVDYDMGKIRLYKIPEAVHTLNLVVYRLPLKDLDWDTGSSASPEIREEYQIPMLHYAAFLAYSKQDVDAFDPQKAMYHLQQFNAEFSDTSAYSETRKRRENNHTVKYGGL